MPKTKTAVKRIDWRGKTAHHAQQNQAFRQAFGTIRTLLDEVLSDGARIAGESQVTESRRVADEMLRLPNP
jgi:hypothetical protein